MGQGDEVVIEERVTAADEVKAYLACARPGFESRTYAPRLHFFEPTGMTGYVPARDDYPEDLLLRDRATHISSGWATRTRDMYGHGGSGHSLKHFKALPRRVQELVEEAGFEPFIHSWRRRSRDHLSYLAALVELRQAGRFDQAVFALCMLYCFLGAASRGVGDTIGGYWRVIELWAYEVLGMFPPENTCTNPSLLPCALAWSTEYRRAKERRGQVMTFQRWLDNITGVTVYWDRWARLEADFLPRSREVTRSRVLLECPLGWQWYLGDRVTRQSLGLPEFVVPGALSPRV
ncbi:hypothetical protein RHMOL_Rhmol05G0144700 [Rhododendron molle]|uniref:Uncharacterized protein n=1 Tax=Rhododendron molle TaxID=49168 RepID=A0ACC0NPC2_RHOML|nr:hypothetical protein RHMOL_Rhmol05G0144700 [Rhododendron molle]